MTRTWVVVVAALLTSGAAWAQRLDHRGSLGLLVASGTDGRQELRSDGSTRVGFVVPLELGGTMAVGYDGDEVKLVLRGAFPAPIIGTVYGGYRSYFGEEALKTFFDIDLRADVIPTFTIGPRAAIGVQYELHSLVGVYATLGAHVGAGQGIRFGVEGLIGVQLRSYLLE